MTGILIIVGFLTLLLLFLWKLEPRSMLNAGVFGLLIAFSYLLLMEIAFAADWGGPLYAYLTLSLFIGAPLLFLIGSLLLVWNGRTVIRREGLTLAHVLAPLVGGIPVLIVFALIGIAFIAMMGGETTSVVGMSILGVVITIYGYLLWNAYCTIPYGAFYTVMPKHHDPDFIIVHGSGLINGDVPPLLASRLDKAIEVFNAGGGRATIIPSGGQGQDESRAESDAMTDYLLARAISPSQIVPEDQSTTTLENMQFSKMIIEKRSTAHASVIFVTSNYHVFRTALIARRVGLKTQGVGSRTARYYLPSAIIREFIAILAMYKWWHIVPIGGVVALIILLDLLV